MKSEERPLTIKQILIECPKCGKKSVVQRSPDVYQCLACDFVRDFSQSPEPEQKTDLFWPVAIVVFLTAFLLILYQQNGGQNRPMPHPQSLSFMGDGLSSHHDS